jgi:acetaldehyde dehydrogenase (acetylating)
MVTDPDLVSIQEVRGKVEQAHSAWTAWTRSRSFTQSKIDSLVESVAAAARHHSQRLAELAVQETGYGNAADKFAKNMLAADVLPRRMRGMRTVGILRENAEDGIVEGIVEIGEPVGVIAAILPTTNPTSTAIYKTLIALKAGNAIVLSPHPRARACSCETAAVLATAAREAGAPEGLVGCIGTSTIESTNELMRHRHTALILSTGGSGIVRAAYSSGTPALGVGPGNVPVLVDVSADIDRAAAKIVEGKSFDYGTVCSSEQTVVAERSLRERLIAAFKSRKAFFASAQQTAALERLLIRKNFSINPECVGQSAQKIAQMAAGHLHQEMTAAGYLPGDTTSGFEIPADAPIIIVEIGGIGRDHPLSAEKLSPVLSLYFVENFAAALDACEAVLRFGGLGHTCGIYAANDARIREYALRMPAYRVVANTSTPQGSTGITTNVFPAMTLGCGAIAGNSTSDNIGPLHLINIKRLAYDRESAPRLSGLSTNPTRQGGDQGGDSVSSSNPTRQGGDRGRDSVADRSEIAAAVERYLAHRSVASPAVARSVANTPSPAPSAPATPAPPAAAEPTLVDFVCEDDVRQAIRDSRKIFIGPKTIVTPSARDLAGPHDILVLVKE